MDNPILIVSIGISGLLLIGGLVTLIIFFIQRTTTRHKTLYDLMDGRMTELIALNKQAAELAGRASERSDQLLRDQQEKAQSDAQRRIETTEQANRIMMEQNVQDSSTRPEHR